MFGFILKETFGKMLFKFDFPTMEFSCETVMFRVINTMNGVTESNKYAKCLDYKPCQVHMLILKDFFKFKY